ncbi:alcohol dehydrogenase catalytic domain-containing protein [Prosthecobacter sp. SYSU 5D2]|uniref:zinc-dependent alcohol dehydrogenase n=1 Tax=Prosthecobacter sp. SYSU 5D2 TaxID=3134134 RepID=UPI0031FE7EC4
MKSVIALHPGQIEILDTPLPSPGPYQALVKTECACVCNRTDSELLHGNFPGMEDKFPFALGHESVGTVVTVGEKVRHFAIGDRAVSGLNFDLQMEGVDSGWGGFGEYTLANDHEAMVADGVADESHGWFEVYEIQTKVDADIPPEEAVLLCTWREVLGAFRDFHLQPGDDVLIYGAGPVGLSFVKLGRLFGLGWIGIVDRHADKQAKALAFGADAVFAPGEKIERSKKLDAVIDAVGHPDILQQGLPLLRRGGSHCIYGVLSHPVLHIDKSKADFNFNLFVHQWPTRKYEKESQPQLCHWIREGKLTSADFITHRFPLDKIVEAFDEIARRKVIKALIEYPAA